MGAYRDVHDLFCFIFIFTLVSNTSRRVLNVCCGGLAGYLFGPGGDFAFTPQGASLDKIWLFGLGGVE